MSARGRVFRRQAGARMTPTPRTILNIPMLTFWLPAGQLAAVLINKPNGLLYDRCDRLE